MLFLSQMIEEYTMAVVMSVVFALPAFYICGFSGSFFVFWLAWLISLFNGIGEAPPDPPFHDNFARRLCREPADLPLCFPLTAGEIQSP